MFTDGVTVLEALKTVFYEQSQQDLEPPPQLMCDRKTSAASSVSGKRLIKLRDRYNFEVILNNKLSI